MVFLYTPRLVVPAASSPSRERAAQVFTVMFSEPPTPVVLSAVFPAQAARERAGQAEAADHDSSREWSGAEEGPGKAGNSSRKPGGRSSPRGAGNGSGGRGGGTVQQRSSPSPSPRLAAVGGGGGSGGKGITTPMTRASKRAGPGRGAVTANGTMGGVSSAFFLLIDEEWRELAG